MWCSWCWMPQKRMCIGKTRLCVCNSERVNVVWRYSRDPLYITGSNIARLGHGSQNSWSKLWIPIMKSAPVRVIFTWKSVPKKSIHGSSDIYWRTQIQWKQAVARLPVVLPFRCHCHLPLLWHNKHYNMNRQCLCCGRRKELEYMHLFTLDIYRYIKHKSNRNA